MATKPRCVSALGEIIVIVPPPLGYELYSVDFFTMTGRWAGRHVNLTLDEAKKRRAEMFRLHRKLAAERAARRRKPAAGA